MSVIKGISGIALLLIAPGCGYHVRGAGGSLPAGMHSIGIPTFRNLTTQFKVEQLLTQAVLKEFAERTRAQVSSAASGVDAVLLGEIQGINAAPVTYNTPVNQQTIASAYMITIRISAKLVRQSDSAVLWQSKDFLYHERYVLSSDVREFFSEENPAIERLAKNFAASLAGSILDRKAP